jgi:hypothetical protein
MDIDKILARAQGAFKFITADENRSGEAKFKLKIGLLLCFCDFIFLYSVRFTYL